MDLISETDRESWNRLLSRYGMVSLIIGLAVSTIVAVSGLREATREAIRTNAELQTANTNTRRLLQQLHELSTIYIEDLENPGALTEEEQRLLHAWLLCDEDFLRLNQNNQQLLFERSLTERRAGTILGFLGDFESATRHFYQSIALLQQLSRQHSNQFDIQLLMIELQGLLAWSYANNRQIEEAVSACETAVQKLELLTVPMSSESDLSLIESIVQAKHVALSLNQIDLALRFSQAERAACSRLSAQDPDNPLSQARLKSANEYFMAVQNRMQDAHAN